MTENETIERCDLLINSLSVDNGVTNAFCDRSKGYVTFEKMREFTLNCKKGTGRCAAVPQDRHGGGMPKK